MRSRILAISSADGFFQLEQQFPPVKVKRDDGTEVLEEQRFKIFNIEHVILVDPDGDEYGFYKVWGEPLDGDPLISKGIMVTFSISYDRVFRVLEAVPAIDLKTRWESMEKTLGDEFAELPSDLPRERLLVMQARIEKMLAAINGEDEEDEGDERDEADVPDVGSASPEASENGKPQNQASSGDKPGK